MPGGHLVLPQGAAAAAAAPVAAAGEPNAAAADGELAAALAEEPCLPLSGEDVCSPTMRQPTTSLDITDAAISQEVTWRPDRGASERGSGSREP